MGNQDFPFGGNVKDQLRRFIQGEKKYQEWVRAQAETQTKREPWPEAKPLWQLAQKIRDEYQERIERGEITITRALDEAAPRYERNGKAITGKTLRASWNNHKNKLKGQV